MWFFVLGVVLSVLFYFKFIRPCGYWSDKGVKHANCWPGVGSMGRVLFKCEAFPNVAVKLYKENENERWVKQLWNFNKVGITGVINLCFISLTYVGYMQFMQQCLLVRDIELIKQITEKDFNHFTFGQGSDADPLLSKSLMSLTGENWGNKSPDFTTSEMKNLHVQLQECVENFVEHFGEEVQLEMRDTFTKVAANIIASTAFGLQIDCLKDPENLFIKKSLRLANFTFWQSIKLILIQTFPELVPLLRLEVFPRDVTKFFRTIIEKRTGQSPLDELTEEEVLGKAMLLFAGFETVSTTSCFMAHELAVNPGVQKKLLKEIEDVGRKYGGKIPYEGILEMKYLDQVVSETLRLWPAAFETDRLCVDDYYIQGRNDEKGFLVQKGVDMVIPTMAIQRDPQYYPEPNRFDPERFNDKNRAKIAPGTYLPFGWGPRDCFGSRLALLEIKTLFCHLLAKFDVVPIARTEVPIKISRRHFHMQPEGGFWLGLKPRKE